MKMKVVKKSQSIFSRLSKNASIALRSASLVSEHFKEKEISVISIFAGILLNEDNLATRVIEEMDLDRGEILRELFGGKIVEITGDTSGVKQLSFSPEAQEVFRKAYDYAQRMSHVYVGTEHLMLAVLSSKDEKVEELRKKGLSYRTFRKSLSMVAMYPVGLLTKPGYREEEEGEDRILDYLGIDLVEMAKEGRLDPVIGRESEIEQLINILSRRKKNNPLIIGEAGVGKTVLVEGLAQRIADGRVPPSLKDMRIILLDVASIMAGSKMRGDVEEKVMSIIQDVISGNNTILFIDEIHNIISSGGLPGSSSDIGSVLKPALLQDEFRCIGATTTEDYSSTFESDNALARRFQPIFLREMSKEDTIEILKNIAPLLEKHHNISIGEKALEAAVSLSDRYVTNRYLPDKAIDLLDEAAASKRLKIEGSYEGLASLEAKLKGVREAKELQITKGNMEKALQLQEKEETLKEEINKINEEWSKKKRSVKNSVDVEDVKTVISKWTGIPLNTLGSEERKALIKLEGKLNKFVVGQEEACSAVASAIKRARTGLIDTERPWASFLFLGPTGVGKTELAKVLTKELFGDEDRLIQIDMSEMMEMHSVSKLIGSPPGYIGYQHGGFLTEQVKRNPHSVILFDEVEKAHPDVLNVLLQILEYGHLTDGRGRRVNFKNTIVILTSNIGAEEIRQDKVLGFGKEGTEKREDKDIDNAYESMKNVLLGELRKSLRPELLNRIDDTVIFRSLTRKDARKIVRLLLKDLNDRLKEEKIKVKLDRKVVTYIVKNAFSEEYGARPLRRFLQDKVENALADYMLENNELFNHNKREEVVTVLMDLDKKKEKIIVKQEK
jgi:ATP-dependent Clp protease ATP-binding subunit ClpC